MKKRAKILLAAALAVCIILSVCVCLVVTSAANYSGSCGNNATYSFTSGTLTVSGSGDMNSYSSATVPWADYRSQIKKVVVSDGITSVGYYAFSNCSELTEVAFASTVTSIGRFAFANDAKLASVTLPLGIFRIF